MTPRFAEKVALVTGAGSGMGRAITIRLAEEGASVLAVDIDGDGLDETLLRASGSVTARQADVSDPQVCSGLVDAAVSEFGRLDVLGNVAGIYIAGHMTDMTREQYRRLMGVNLDGYFFLAQAAIPHLLETDGNIVNIASNAGLQGVPYSVVYSMTKGGVVQLTRSLAVEFLKRPLRVNAIAPAGTNTNIGASTTFPARRRHRPRHPDGGPPGDGGARGGRRAVRVPRLRRSALHHRGDLHARQRPHRQLTRVALSLS